MKNLFYTVILWMLITGPSLHAQVGTGFEEPFGGSGDYVDPDVSTTHTLINIAAPAATVAHTYSGGELGFTTTFTPSRTGTPGTQGLSDADAVGVHDNTTLVGSTDLTTWATGQAYIIEDPDGMITVAVDPVSLSGTTNPQFTMDLWVDATSYETGNGANDRVYIRLEIDGGATVIDVLDSDGGGTGGGSGGDLDTYIFPGTASTLETVITNISVDLSAHVGSTVQLIIEADFDSGSEKVVFDNINFTEGTASAGLPVELSEFKAERKNNQFVNLNWSTLSEYNNKGFYVERMIGGETEFERIDFVKGEGSTAAMTNYTYSDQNSSDLLSYYRLQQMDNDGKVTYSDVVAVRPAEYTEQEVLLIQSGSITNHLNIQVTDPDQAATLQKACIFDLSGQCLQITNLQSKTGNINLPIAEEWSAGVYLLRLDWEGGYSITKKFVKE